MTCLQNMCADCDANKARAMAAARPATRVALTVLVAFESDAALVAKCLKALGNLVSDRGAADSVRTGWADWADAAGQRISPRALLIGA